MEKDYLTIKELIKNENFRNISIIAGESGLFNKAKNVVILETPDGMNWLRGNEIVLTTGYAYYNNEKKKCVLMEIAHKKRVAAIAIKSGRYYGEIEEKIIEDANRYSIPLLLMDKETNYTDIVSCFYELLFNKKNKNILKINTSYYKLLNLQIQGVKISDIIKEVEDLTKLKVEFYRFYEVINNLNKILRFPIYHNGEIMGYLIVENEKKLNGFQKNSIKYALSLIKNQLILEQDVLLSQSIINGMIADIILSNEELDERFFYSVTSYLNWDAKNYYGIYIKWFNKNKGLNAKIRKIVEISINKKFLFSLDKDNMVLFLPIELKELENLLLKIRRSINDGETFIKIGVSTQKSNLCDMNTAYKESKMICYSSKGDISYLEKFSNEKILLNLLENDEIREYYNEILYKLSMYDEKKNMELLNTIRTFINCNLKFKDTADSLYIHVETLRYRLNKIKEITGYDIGKSSDLMHLIMALSLYEYL